MTQPQPNGSPKMSTKTMSKAEENQAATPKLFWARLSPDNVATGGKKKDKKSQRTTAERKKRSTTKVKDAKRTAEKEKKSPKKVKDTTRSKKKKKLPNAKEKETKSKKRKKSVPSKQSKRKPNSQMTERVKKFVENLVQSVMSDDQIVTFVPLTSEQKAKSYFGALLDCFPTKFYVQNKFPDLSDEYSDVLRNYQDSISEKNNYGDDWGDFAVDPMSSCKPRSKTSLRKKMDLMELVTSSDASQLALELDRIKRTKAQQRRKNRGVVTRLLDSEKVKVTCTGKPLTLTQTYTTPDNKRKKVSLQLLVRNQKNAEQNGLVSETKNFQEIITRIQACRRKIRAAERIDLSKVSEQKINACKDEVYEHQERLINLFEKTYQGMADRNGVVDINKLKSRLISKSKQMLYECMRMKG